MILCKRCGNQISADRHIELEKCAQCKDVKFDRAFFAEMVDQLMQNFHEARSTRFGKILKTMYLFGSYAAGAPRCGDLDVLVTYSRPKLRKIVRQEIASFRMGLSEIWDFNECEEYPDCLICFDLETCGLPEKDYHSEVHLYCLEECKNPEREPFPKCLVGSCTFLESQIEKRVDKIIWKMLTDNIEDRYRFKPGLDLKILDLGLTPTIGDFARRHGFTGFKAVRVAS